MTARDVHEEEPVIVIEPRAPYTITPHLKQFTLKNRPTPCIYDEESRSCARLVTWGVEEEVAYEATILSEGWEPLVKVHVIRGPPETAVKIVKHVLNTDYVYPDTSTIIEICPGLGRMIEEYPGLRPALNPSMWESLVKAIVNQQLPINLALRITSKLVEHLGEKISISKNRTLYGFPTPLKVLDAGAEKLRNIGLSRRKAEYVIGIAEAIVRQGYDLEKIGGLPPRRAIDELVGLRGVGPWTAKLAYMAYTGNLNLFLPEDLAVRRGLRLAGCRKELISKTTSYAGLISYLAAALYELSKKT